MALSGVSRIIQGGAIFKNWDYIFLDPQKSVSRLRPNIVILVVLFKSQIVSDSWSWSVQTSVVILTAVKREKETRKKRNKKRQNNCEFQLPPSKIPRPSIDLFLQDSTWPIKLS